jgi:DNA-binding LacI/PurR family transcriptional regulator
MVRPGREAMMLSRTDPRKRKVVLQHDAEAAAQMTQIDGAQLIAVDLHEAAELAVDALEQAGNRRFAGAAAPDDAEHLAGRRLEAHPIERRYLGAGIGEGHVVEGDRPGGRTPRDPESLSSGRLSTDEASPIAAPTSS